MIKYNKKDEPKKPHKPKKPDKDMYSTIIEDGKTYKRQDEHKPNKPPKPEGSDKIWLHQV